MIVKNNIVVLLHILAWTCPVIAFFWFTSSLDYRVETGWRDGKFDLEFYNFKMILTLLLIAPLFSLSYHLVDRAGYLQVLLISSPGIYLFREFVGQWMIFLCMASRGEVSLGFGIRTLVLLSIPLTIWVYGPVCFVILAHKFNIRSYNDKKQLTV